MNFPAFFACALFCFSSAATIQYRPIASAERHEIVAGWAVGKPLEGVFPSSDSKALFLDYSLYFPEVTAFLPQPWKKIGAVGMSAGSVFLPKGDSFCGKGGKRTPSLQHIGLKMKVSYFEKILPFMEYGFSRAGCLTFSENFRYSAASGRPAAMRTYFSIGLNLSFKVIDRRSVYNLDQDYGLNDMGIRAQCRRYYGTGAPVLICSAGLSLLF